MGKEVAVKKETALAMYSGFEEAAGVGFEEATTQDLSIPFLRILAQLSPQVNKRDGAYVQGAEAGMIFNTVANEAYNGEDGILVVPCYYTRRYVEWKPREQGGGYVSSYGSEDPIVQTTHKDDRGNDILPNGNLLTNTAQFYVLLIHPEMGPQRCLITMTSTQLKKARKWLTQMQALTGRNKAGALYTLPMMSNVYQLRTVEERNDKGSWFGWEVSRIRQLDLGADEDKEMFEIGFGFAKAVRSGEVKVKETSEEPAPVERDNIPF
jgi:hypothetical protein